MADTVVMSEGFQAEDMTVVSALNKIFMTCRNHHKLALGSAEVVKALLRSNSAESADALELVIMAKDLLQEYQTIIVEKCKEFNVPVIYVDDRKQLAEISPLKRAKNVGVVGIRDFVYESREKRFIFNALKN
ncbi:small subunit ribosomal protein S12e [Pancytospora philotis]|nr:small subunit ribosomal protein S12e [Pancytospora philotis]